MGSANRHGFAFICMLTLWAHVSLITEEFLTVFSPTLALPLAFPVSNQDMVSDFQGSHLQPSPTLPVPLLPV